MSRHEVYGYEKLICYGLKRISYHIFKGPSTEQDDENSRNCHSVSHRKYKHFAILCPFMLAALLEMFYRIPQKDTGKLKSFLWQQKERK